VVTAEQEQAAATIQQSENYAFVLNVARLVDAPAYDLAPGHKLRRATPQEVSRIKQTIENYAGANPVAALMWEHRATERGALESLPEHEWRYFVIAFDGSNSTVVELEHAFNIAPLELEVGFTFVGVGGLSGLVMNPDQLYHIVSAARWQESGAFFLDVAAEDVRTISHIHTQLQQHDPAVLDVNRLAIQLGQLKALPHGSPLRFLGYFALLESVLTHPPKPSDPYDSITRQVKTKLALLDHRWQPRMDYSPFGGANPDRIWTRMYQYRSLLAHGGTTDFTGELAVLVNHVQALKLLKRTTKAVIRQTLAEPQLLVDLREC
jgi:hypothetical protein